MCPNTCQIELQIQCACTHSQTETKQLQQKRQSSHQVDNRGEYRRQTTSLPVLWFLQFSNTLYVLQVDRCVSNKLIEPKPKSQLGNETPRVSNIQNKKRMLVSQAETLSNLDRLCKSKMWHKERK